MVAVGSCWPLADDALVRTLAAGGPCLEEEGCDSFFAGVLPVPVQTISLSDFFSCSITTRFYVFMIIQLC